MTEEEKTEVVETPPLFETHSVWTKAMFLELQKSAVKSRLWIWAAVISAIWIPVIVLNVIGKDWIMTLLLFILYGLLVCYLFYLPYGIAKRQYNQYRVLYGKDMEYDLCFREETVTSVNLLTGGKLSMGYEKFRRLVKTKNLYILYMEKKMVFFFHRNDFITGDAASFEAFIAGKCPQTKKKSK